MNPVQKPVGLKLKKSQCFGTSVKVEKNPMSQLKGSEARGIPFYSGEGQSFHAF